MNNTIPRLDLLPNAVKVKSLEDLNSMGDSDKLYYELGHYVPTSHFDFETNQFVKCREWVKEGVFEEIIYPKDFITRIDAPIQEFLSHHNFQILKKE